MDRRIALVDGSGTAVQVLIVGEDWTAPDGVTVMETARASQGDVFDANRDGFASDLDYVAPEQDPAPSTPGLQRYQFLAMLDIAGLKDKTDTAIAAIADPVQRAVARAKFDSVQTFERDDPLLVALAAAAGLTGAQVDGYWTQAAGL